MRPALVIVIDPGLDNLLGFFEGPETMLPDALKLQRPHERFDDAVLRGRMRQGELLTQAVLGDEPAIKFRGVDQRVVGSKGDADVLARWEGSKPSEQRIFEGPSGFFRVVALADVATNAFAIGAIQNRVNVDEPIEFGPHVRRVGGPTYVGNGRNTRARFNARPAPFAPALVALPPLELHDALNRLAVYHDAFHTQASPHHAVAQIRLVIREMLDALR